MESSIKSFVEHNYIVVSENSIKRQAYGVAFFCTILSFAIYILSANGFGSLEATVIDIIFAAINIIILISTILCIKNVGSINDNCHFVRLQMICAVFNMLSAYAGFGHTVYKMLGGQGLIFCYIYVGILDLCVSRNFYRKQKRWIVDGAYRDNTDEIQKWDKLHTKLWHKDSYYGAVGIGICFLLKIITIKGYLVAIAVMSIEIILILDIIKYGLQLKYAEQYDLTEYLPQAPNDTLKPY